MKNVGLLLVALVLVAVVLGAVTVGAFYWYSEQQAEQKLQYYIGKLENRYTVEERSLSDFDVDDLEKLTFWNDFTFDAECENADRIYFDRKMHILYFLKADENGVKAYVFYYNRILWDLILRG